MFCKSRAASRQTAKRGRRTGRRGFTCFEEIMFWHGVLFCTIEIAREKNKQTETCPLTCSDTVPCCAHRVQAGAKQLTWEKCLLWVKREKYNSRINFQEVRLHSTVSVCVCVSVCWAMLMSAATLFFRSCVALLIWHYRALQHYWDYQMCRLQCDIRRLTPQCLVWQLKAITAHLLNSWTHLTCWIALRWPEKTDFRR